MQAIMEIIRGFITIMGSPFWGGISAIALIITFIIIWKYTKATRDLAQETRAMAKASSAAVDLQKEEIGLQKRPVVSVYCLDPSVLNFRTAVHNFSMVHAKARFKATIKLNNDIMKLAAENHYAGNRIWHIQAMGQNSSPFQGHLDLDNVIKANDYKEWPRSKFNIEVTIESWVINYYEDESALFDDQNKNPTCHWYWNNVWIPEIAPLIVKGSITGH